MCYERRGVLHQHSGIVAKAGGERTVNEKEKSRIIAGTMTRQEQSLGASDPHNYSTASNAGFQAGIARILCYGAENAQTAKELARVLGLSDERIVTKQIERERLRGIPICAGNNGYYLPKDDAELEAYTKQFESRRKHIGKTAAALQYALAVMRGQEFVEGMD